MRKILFIMVMAVITTATVTARQLTPTEALSRMKQAALMSKSLNSVPAEEHSYTLAYTSVNGDAATYYAFNRTDGEGFVVLSADDCMPAVLMESDEGGNFIADSIPDGMRWWLSQYDKAVTRYAAEGKAFSALSANPEITPLLETNGKKTAWSQETPYNNLCPSYNGEKAATGCVITAMAQIMRFHEYPKVGKGKMSYDFDFFYTADGKTQYIPMKDSTDFSAHEYCWSDMIDTYTMKDNVPNYTEQQASAVATLMHDCGVANSADYGNRETGADARRAICSLVDYFGYDASVIYLDHCLYTDEQWEQKIYDELQAGRPVLYQGTDQTYGGHCFVCDGYKDGLYHINWGWNGWRNCYVLLVSSDTEEALTPVKESEKDIDYSFTLSQSACFNIMPDNGGVMNPDLKILASRFSLDSTSDDQGQNVEQTTFCRSQQLTITGFFINMCYRKRTYDFGVKLSNDDTTFYYECGDAPVDMFFVCDLTVNLKDVKDGTYVATPVFKDLTSGDTEWHDMSVRLNFRAPEITVKGDQPTSVETVKARTKANTKAKVLKKGRIVIKKNDTEYNASGQLIK